MGISVFGGSEALGTTIQTAEIDDSAVTPAKLENTTVTPGSYTYMGATVDADGRLTAAANGTAPYVPGGTDVAIVDGGTGAGTAADARTALGLVIGTNVQAWDTDLDTMAAAGMTGTGAVMRAISPTTTGTFGAEAITASSTITPSQTAGIVGTTTNNDANAGSVGEVLSAIRVYGSALSLTNDTIVDVTSVVLSAGDWDCWGTVDYLFGAGTTYTELVLGVSTTSVTIGSQGTFLTRRVPATVPGQFYITEAGPIVRVLTTGTTVYLIAKATFTVSTVVVSGTITCRRVR